MSNIQIAAATAVVLAAWSSTGAEASSTGLSAPVISARHPSWEEYKQIYNKKFSTTEEDSRRAVFYAENMKRADEMQKLNPSATFGHNLFSYMSASEFKVMHNAESYYKRELERRAKPEVAAKIASSKVENNGSIPSSIDWRKKGAVTYVKNQGQCGSCWSFSTTGGIEGQWFLAGHSLVALSEQEFVSCDHVDQGCNGGLMDNAFEWVVSNRQGQVTSETAYPYVSGEGQVPYCQINGKPTAAVITGHRDLAHSESAMKDWMATGGPISIAVDASSWQTYQGGIMTNCVSTQLDHGVLAVGYDMNNNPPYWIIKNSWSPSWGENGYIRVEYGTNQCLLDRTPCHPIASKGPVPPPGPPGPTPPTPPSPPSPSGGTFTQYQCPSYGCQSGCQGHTFPQGQCLQMEGGGSAIAQCTSSDLVLSIFPMSSSCSGNSEQQRQPLNQCLQDTTGTYIKNTCNSGADAKMAGAQSKLMKIQ